MRGTKGVQKRAKKTHNKAKVMGNKKPVKLLFYNNLTGFVCVVLRYYVPAICRYRN